MLKTTGEDEGVRSKVFLKLEKEKFEMIELTKQNKLVSSGVKRLLSVCNMRYQRIKLTDRLNPQ